MKIADEGHCPLHPPVSGIGMAVSMIDLISMVLGMRRKLETRPISDSLAVRERMVPLHDPLGVMPALPSPAPPSPLSFAS